VSSCLGGKELEMKKILYIEDDPVSVIFIAKIVEKIGHQIITASSSEDGLAKAYAERPDLILMDIFLPGLDGFETTMRIRQSEMLKHIPIIAITATHNPGDRQLAAVAGCDGFLMKPVDYPSFVSYINEFLDKRHVVQEDRQDETGELKKFSQRLVQRLTDKIQELAHANEELIKTNQTMDHLVSEVRTNNSDLLQFNFSSNQILSFSSREKLYKDLPHLLCNELKMISAAIYVVNEQDMTLDIFSQQHVQPDPSIEKFSITKPPFFDVVYNQQAFLMDTAWMHVAQKADDAMVKRVMPLNRAFQSPAICFLPIIGRPSGENGLDCQNTDCQAFMNKDKNWWSKQIGALDPNHLYFETQLRQLSVFYFNCCLYRLKGVLALGIGEERLNENFRQILQSFVRTIGLTIENIQLYDDVKDAYLVAEQQAITDGLTGIYNFRYFHHQLEREIKRSKRHWNKTSLIMIDIDFFKNYNDHNGHPAGDLALKRLAEILQSCTRTSDVVARYGGEEFVLILPETPKSAAVKLAEKIRNLVAQEKFSNEENQPQGNFTVSLGVSTFPDNAQTAEELVLRADEQLYHSKQTGRNRVSFVE
jgi:diguanylate cyclase (GGDEF)-like protein